MNLASQSVLEGLNACFDHRRLIYIAELNKSFEIPDDGNCRFFACQNPHVQGGNRRALPKSFINRFTNIYVDDLTEDDVFSILRDVDGGLLGEICLRSMVALNSHLATIDRLEGGPFSFNLRDLLRWIQLFATNRDMATSYELLYVSRMRNEENKKLLRSLYEDIFGEPCVLPPVLLTADKNKVQIGKVCVEFIGFQTLIKSSKFTVKYTGLLIIDKSAISDSKKLLKERLHGLVDEEVLRDISIAQDLLQLEIATEVCIIHYLSPTDAICVEDNISNIFRVFLSMDARNGEISRAMRNRSVELYLGTDQRWYTSIQDVTTLKISKNVAMDLTALPVENLLHFCVLLNEMSLEDACRSLSIGFVETSEKEVCEVLPEVKDLVTESYQSWLVSVWKNTSVEDSLSKIFLCLLSSSTYSIRSRHIEKQFGHVATPFTCRAIEITQDLPLSTHAVDARFNNGCWNREDIYSIDKFVLNLLCEWSLNMIQILIVEQGEVATCDIGFKNLHLISRVVDGILMALKEVSFERKPKKITSVFNSSEFSNLNAMMNSEWSVESHERFVRDYLVLYEDHKIVYPFSNEDDCQRLISFVDHRMECDSEEIELDRDFDEYVENRSILKSPIAITLQLVNRMLNLLLFQVTGTVDKSDPLFISQEMLRMFNWMDESTAKFVKMLTVLNSNYNGEDKVSSIPSLGAFSIIYVSFWSSLSFDPSMSLLSISDLRHFELTEFAKQLWQLAPNSPRISQNIKFIHTPFITLNDLGIITCGLSGWSNQEKEKQNSWEERLETGINIMNNVRVDYISELSLPPPKTLDPVIFEEEKAKYIGLKLEIVNRQLQILSEFRYSTSRQFPTCDSRSQHPQIASLWEIREQLNNELNEKKSVKETVYRQRASQYNTLCSELRSFRDVSLSIVSVLHKLNDSIRKVHELSSDEHQIILAQLKSYVMSAVNFKQLMATSRGIESPQLLAWCCRDASTMPLRLKAAIVRHRITERIDPRCDLEWTRRHWQKWYERNVAKAAEKDFIYRNKTEEERDELNVKEFFSMDDQDEGILSTEDLSLLLDALEPQFPKKVNDSNKQTKEAYYSLALVWIRHLLMGIGQFEEKLHSATVEPDLSLLHWIISREDVDHLSIVDVYRSSSLKEFRRAADLLDALITRIKEVQERWPEIVALKLIVDAINNFLSAPLSTTQIKMASRIESVIEQAEEWEKIADRNNSLREQLEPIRKLLVDWKKMEAKCFFKPIFYPISNRLTVLNMLVTRDPAEYSLKDYLKIVKYNDLNLWNIRVSSQKAHAHLFKIIRKFKDAINVEVAPIFDNLLGIDEWLDIKEVEHHVQTVTGDRRTKRAQELVKQILINGVVKYHKLVRVCASGRNICIRKANHPNDQLGVATRKHLSGIVEYGMAWILKVQKRIAVWETSAEQIAQKTNALNNMKANVINKNFQNCLLHFIMFLYIRYYSFFLLYISCFYNQFCRQILNQLWLYFDQNVSCWSDAERMWSEISRSVNILSAELAENLRLILEPQRATRMKGDYRTGKRLNMRKLIPYIASDYRKDRIWMRRTKRAQREYQVLTPYMKLFPFPFYAIIKGISQLPSVLAESIRQWFELTVQSAAL
uniref:BACK domain-containing protein n=1 Tax=Heterorhabditis bacteriophora TaxID=37862 RepID=A0A1I7XML4_HETBA